MEADPGGVGRGRTRIWGRFGEVAGFGVFFFNSPAGSGASFWGEKAVFWGRPLKSSLPPSKSCRREWSSGDMQSSGSKIAKRG